MTSYCVFNVGERRVAIELTYVREIVEHHLVVPTPIPLTPQFVHGLFNLRGQVLPYLDLSPFVGAKETPAAPGRDDRAVIVERGNLRFATSGQKIDTVEADASTFTPLENAALLPALDVEAHTDYGRFHVIHLDRLEACLSQSLKLTEAGPAVPTSKLQAPGSSAAEPQTQNVKPETRNSDPKTL
ncbi:MAG TPA: chemotaxis protein CheW [Verrucomicrobiae bacterium]|nr:chemotaxis protein CheW [Verrucomicrobiae bacterium]